MAMIGLTKCFVFFFKQFRQCIFHNLLLHSIRIFVMTVQQLKHVSLEKKLRMLSFVTYKYNAHNKDTARHLHLPTNWKRP